MRDTRGLSHFLSNLSRLQIRSRKRTAFTISISTRAKEQPSNPTTPQLHTKPKTTSPQQPPITTLKKPTFKKPTPKTATPKPKTKMDIPTQLQTSLSTTTTPLPSLPWLRTLCTPRTPTAPLPPLASLLATARTRLLSSDLTTPGLLDARWAATHALPAQLAVSQAGTRESKLVQDVVVQVLDVEDVSRSRWEQAEGLEALARGEGTRGREVVRLPTAGGQGQGQGEGADGEGNGDGEGQEGGGQNAGQQQQQQQQQQAAGGGSTKNSTHKLVVQDCKGQKVTAIELKRVERLAIGKTFIGEKILLRAGTVVARGVVLLDPAQCVVLGGKVDAWHRAWVDGRLARLKEAVGAERRA